MHAGEPPDPSTPFDEEMQRAEREGLSRRQFLAGIGAMAVGTALHPHIAGAEPGGRRARAAGVPDRPNIVLLITDQERAPQHWPQGWPEANLPARRRLVDTGITFTRAFCNSCMCSPSRSTLLTGLYPMQHGVVDTLTEGGQYSPLEQVLPLDMQNMARMLKSVGYDVVYKGKWHVSKPLTGTEFTPQDAADYGFDGWDPPDAGEDTAPEHFGGGRADNDRRFTDDAVQFLSEVDPSRPFALIVSLVNPHDVLAYPSMYQDDYDLGNLTQGIELPPTIDEDLSSKPSCQKAFLQRTPLVLGALPTDAQRRAYVNFYAYLHTLVDVQIGRILDALEAPRGLNGKDPSLRESTIVIRTADHGEMGLSHGGMRQKAFNVYEESIRVPLIVSNPTLFPTPVSSDSLVSLIDLMPTIATLTNVDRSAWEFRGVDLSPILTDPSATVQNAVHFTFDDQRAGNPSAQQAVPQPNHIRCIRQEGWKYALYFDPEKGEQSEYEMYDLTADPLETNNLANSADPTVQAKRTELHDALMELMVEKGTLPPALSAVEDVDRESAVLRIEEIGYDGGTVTVRLRLAVASFVALDVVDTLGRRLGGRPSIRLETGEHSIQCAVPGPVGVYFCRLRAGDAVVVRKFVHGG